ncbi:hypothetical protein [Paenibacillus campinasensis]|uniref:Uncharacterized protein n=1 Tax=Paenibacillus campinasensis TaxID=66347 RepID=A0A268EH45_9BACL|nr:hypothetical protein [Paenibacillus campinasensis]PAD72432.1 hypothetical protein CHH67_22590 [Paenibacillus campinasensis]
MKIAFMHTNGYDAILLENGTWFQPEPHHVSALLNIKSEEGFVDWNGSELFNENDVPTEVESWVNQGAVLVAYFDSEGLSIEDQEVWNERIEFYGVGEAAKEL